MSYNGSGTYTPPSPEYPAVSGTIIYAADWNTIVSDIASALSSVLVKDGQSAMTGILDLGGFKGINGATPVNPTDVTIKSYVDAADALLSPLIVTADRSMYGYKITNLGMPSASTDAATKGYVDTYYAPLASPVLTGIPEAPTAAVGTNTTQIATMEAIQQGLATMPVGALPSLANKARFNLRVTSDETGVEWGAGVLRSARTSNTILAAADTALLIDITSGAFSQTFTAAATLRDGWFCYIRNSGTGDITLDPNGAETIDGLASYIMYPGECRLVMCTGSAFVTTVLSPFSKTFTSTATFTTPPGYSYFAGYLWGGGGGGGYGAAAQNTGGGGGGACVPFTLTATQLGTSKTITIGAGGASQSSAASGGAGGNSDIGTTLVTAYGGGGGGGGAGTSYGGGGGGALSAGSVGNGAAGGGGGQPQLYPTVSTPALNNMGFGGSAGGTASGPNTNNSGWGGAGGGVNDSSTIAGKSIYGGGGGAGVGSANIGSAGGTSMFGGAGGASSNAGAGTAGTVPGGGGGATHSGANSGAGAAGQCIIWGVA